MIKYQIKNSIDLLYQLLGSFIFFLLAFFISRLTANNDIYVQLLAIDGILSELDFSGVGQHPVGIAMVASLFKLCKLDPLICLYFLQPVLCGLCFWILFRLVRSVMPDKHAFFITFSSLSSLVLIQSMHQVTAEIISLVAILFFISYVWKNIIQDQNMNFKIISIMVILSWMAILCRHTAMFIIVGVLIFFYLNNIFSRLKLFLIGTIILFPGVIKGLFFYKEIVRTHNLFSFNTPLIIITQLSKHFLDFTEIILPYSLHLNRAPLLKGLICLICLFIFLLMIWQKKDSDTGFNRKKLLGDYFFTIGISYYCILSFASVYCNYNYSDLYRVSGFGILFILNGFWLYIFSYAIKWRKYILIILMISSITKISYGLRYEILSERHRFLFQDYRRSVNSIIDYEDGRREEVFVYIGEHWEDINLFYLLKYYDLIYSLPFEVSQYKDQKEKTSSVILCTEKDLNHFQVLKYRFNKIPGLDKVYSVVN